jgi:pyridoxine kinase
MRALCEEADFILPNVTEACLLSGEKYPLLSERLNVEKILQKLRSSHTCPIVTGVDEGDESCVYYINNNEIKRYASKRAEGFFHGAGDVFAAAFCGALARGKGVTDAVALATDFTSSAVFRTAKENTDRRYGLAFEQEILPFLKNLNKEMK